MQNNPELPNLQEKCYLILGFGLTGKSILNFILDFKFNCLEKLTVIVYDQKEHLDLSLGSSWRVNDSEYGKSYNNLTKDLFIITCNEISFLPRICKVDIIITSPGIDPKTLKIINQLFKVPIVSDIQFFIQSFNFNKNNNILAVTGTNGKSTVCALLNTLLNKKKFLNYDTVLGGNFGVPILDLLSKELKSGCQYNTNYILELSSFQLALTNFLPCLAAVCLNIAPDHLYWHGNMNNYINDKLKIYNDSSFDIINFDQKIILQNYIKNIFFNKINKNKKFQVILYSLERSYKEMSIEANKSFSNVHLVITLEQNYVCFNNQKLIAISALPLVLQSEHNISNLLAVICLLCALFSSRDIIKNLIDHELFSYLTSLKYFNGLPHRCELIADFNGVKVYNDSKGTNLSATITALNSINKLISGKIWLILGGVAKEDIDDIESIKSFQAILDKHVAGVIVYGNHLESRKKIINILPSSVKTLIIEPLGDLLKVTNLVFANAIFNDAILFSPACASFDMFNNYIHRGESFCTAVNQYIQQYRSIYEK